MAKTIEFVGGKRVITETIKYSSGRVVKRIFNTLADIVPADIVVVARGHIGKAPVNAIEHREVMLYRQHYNC